MKRSTFITFVSLLIPLFGISQMKEKYIDDIYSKPGDVKQVSVKPQHNQQVRQLNSSQTPNYKNGAKEIVFIDRENPNTQFTHDTVYVVGKADEIRKNIISTNNAGHDTVYVVAEANDNTENNPEQGYYLNGFKGTESDLEYAERIRHFHNPRYEINIADPRYNDIYFLNDYDWNVYIEGNYAYVTPTWTNPAWWNYTYSPYSYSNWGFGYTDFYSPFSPYGNWFDYPWGFDNCYGGLGYYGLGGYFGNGGYYGFGYPYYGYNEGYWGNSSSGNWGGGKHHKDADVRLQNGISSREGGFGYNNTRTAASSRIASNQYTVISGSHGRNTISGKINNNPGSSSRSVSGIGLIRNGFGNRTNGLNASRFTTSTRSEILNINTRPRTSNYNSNNLNNYSSRSMVNSNSNATTNRSINAPRINYSSGNNSSYHPSSINSGSSRSSSPSYSGSSSSSGSSYSGGGSSGGSRSSGGGGGRR